MIALFETDYRNIERYYLVHDKINKEFVDDNVIILFESKSQIKPFKKKYKNSRCISLTELETVEYNHLIINGNRIPDIYVSIITKQKNIPITYIQHGPHSIHMIRSKSFFISNLKKTLRYLFYCFKIYKLTKKTKLFITLILKNTKGGSRVNKSLKLYTPNFSYVYSEFYKKWHIENYFGLDTEYYLLRNRDNIFKPTKKQKALVFCYQTLVEDGRIDPKIFFKNLDKIKEFAENRSLKPIIKSHPRMSLANRKFLSEEGWEIFDSKTKIPVGHITVGYYSSLLSLWAFYMSPVISIKINNHYTPDEVSSYCFSIEINQLKNFDINVKNEILKQRSERVDFLFNYSGKEKLRLD
tara:strand:- start:193 stop:1254 length:1062 start_codon:yes stop_codon:yes gene_type:complete